MEDNKTRIYDLLVEEKDDFLGIIAYSVYKRQKREQCADFASKNGGRCPTNEELEPFYALAKSPTQIDHFKNEAWRLTEIFGANLLAEKEAEIIEENEKRFQQKCLNLRSGFWRGVWQSVVGSFVFVLALGLLTIILWSADVGPKAVFEKVFKVKVEAQAK